MNLLLTLFCILASINIIVPQFFFWWKNKKQNIGIVISTFIIGVAITAWQFALIARNMSYQDESLQSMYTTIGFASGLLLAFGFLLATLFFPTTQFPESPLKNAAYAALTGVLIFLIVLTLGSNIVVDRFDNGKVIMGPLGWLFDITVVFAIFFIGYAFVQRYRRETLSQEFYRYILVYIIILLGFTLLFNFLLPQLGYSRFVVPGALVYSTVGIFIAYTTSRTRLYTISYLMQTVISALIVCAYLYGTFYLIGNIDVRLWGSIASIESIVINVFFLFIATIVLKLINEILLNYIKVRFFKKTPINIKVRDINFALNNTTSPDEVLKIVEQTICSYVRIKGVSSQTVGQFGSFLTAKQKQYIMKRLKQEFLLLTEENYNFPALAQELRNHDISLIMVAERDANNNIRSIFVVNDYPHSAAYMPQELIDLLNNLQTIIEVSLQRNKLFEKTKNFSDLLQQEVAERTEEVENSKEKLAERNTELKTALKSLESLNTAKSEFISVASHQLQTPISVISGYLSMLSAEQLGKLTTKQAQTISKAASVIQQLTKIVDDLLNATRVELGEMNLTPELFDLAVLIKETVEQMRSRVEAKGLSLTCNIEVEKFIINADQEKIREILIQLIENALNYTNLGGIHVHGELDKERKNSFILSVKDSGIGIPDEFKPDIFKRFTRAKNAKKHLADGTGVGLYVTKAFVEAHHGKIWYTSKVDRGTTFFVELKNNPPFE